MAGAIQQILFSTSSAISVINIGHGTDDTAAVSSRSITTTEAIPAGALVVVGVTENSTNSVTITAVSDGTNTYTQAGTNATATNTSVSLWYCIGAASVGAGATITATFSGASGAASNCGISAAAIVGSGSVFDVSGKNSAASANTLSAVTGALAQAAEIIVGYAGFESNGSGGIYSASGFTNISSVLPANPTVGSALDYQIVNSISSVTYTPTWSALAGRIGCVVAAFKK